MLQRSGYAVLTAADGREGLEIFAKHEDIIVIIVLDVTMPRMSGDEVLTDLRRRGKTVPVVLASGYTAQAIPQIAGDPVPPVFVQKPYVISELLAGIDDALARFAGSGQ
jgi:two-component system, cell cycle sensor histidine kinase and response regulator CckA